MLARGKRRSREVGAGVLLVLFSGGGTVWSKSSAAGKIQVTTTDGGWDGGWRMADG